MKYLIIKRKDGSVNTVRYECEAASESSLTYQEEIVKELYHKNEELEQQNEQLQKDKDYMIEQYNLIVQQKAELIDSLKNIVGTCKNFASNVSIGKQMEVLKKYSGE